MATKKIVCDCGQEMYEHDRIAKKTGYQYTEDVVGYYVLYKCHCGQTHWEYVSR